MKVSDRSFVLGANLADTYGKTLCPPEAISIVWNKALPLFYPIAMGNRGNGGVADTTVHAGMISL